MERRAIVHKFRHDSSGRRSSLSTPEGVIQKNTVVADHLASERSKTQILLSLIYGV